MRAAHLANIPVIPIPGACAAITALCASGLPTDRFVFEGFLPAKSLARQQRLTEVKDDPRTLVYYESPHRIIAMLTDLIAIFGPTRRATLARELTKQFETIRQDELAVLLEFVQQNAEQQLGEFVVIVAGAEAQKNTSDQQVEKSSRYYSQNFLPNKLLVSVPKLRVVKKMNYTKKR